MHAHIIVAHPEPVSFNMAMSSLAHSVLLERGFTVEVSDLYRDRFEPVASGADFVHRANSDTLYYLAEQRNAAAVGGFSPDIAREQARLSAADFVYIQFPIWWGSPPAILKGWFDRVLAAGFAFGPGRTGRNGPFNGKTALLGVTAGGPVTRDEAEALLRPVENGLEYTGMKVLEGFVAPGPAGASLAERTAMLDEFSAHLRGQLSLVISAG